MSRRVVDLAWAQRHPAGWPAGIPKPRLRGIKAFGGRYEKAVGKALPEAEKGVWWEFRDRNGPGLCQTDFVLPLPDVLVVIECKHTWTDEGMDQLAGLYIPVLQRATGQPVIGIQVCKHLVPWAGTAFSEIGDAISMARACRMPVTLHWRGISPITGRGEAQLAAG